jgi:hypothetical protein
MDYIKNISAIIITIIAILIVLYVIIMIITNDYPKHTRCINCKYISSLWYEDFCNAPNNNIQVLICLKNKIIGRPLQDNLKREEKTVFGHTLAKIIVKEEEIKRCCNCIYKIQGFCDRNDICGTFEKES